MELQRRREKLLRRIYNYLCNHAWLILAGLLVGIFFLNYFYLKLSEITVSVPIILALLNYVKDWWTKRQETKSKERKINQEIKKLKDYLQHYFHNELITPEIKEFGDEEDIHHQFIEQNFSQIDDISINSLLLCFYSYLWDKTNSPNEYEKIQKYSYSIGLSFADIDAKTKIFLNVFDAFRQNRKYKSLDEILNIPIDYVKVLRHFSQKYLKELSFFDIKEKLNQSENLRVTLVNLIKEGELSNWGITQETLERLEKDLKKEIEYSKTYLVIGNKFSDEVKEFLSSQPRFNLKGLKTVNTPKLGIYSAFIVKPRGVYSTSKKLLNKLKSLNKSAEESILYVVPLDFLNYDSHTLPANQSFSTQNLKNSYEAINWFRTGYEYSDTDIWNAIGKSSITPQELLAIVPFNIFCKGILPCEQTFMIKNYKKVKGKCGVNLLMDWKDKDANLIVNYLLESGIPDYNKLEKEQILKVRNNDIKTAVKLRMKDLVDQIIKNSYELDKSLTLMLEQYSPRTEAIKL